MPLELDPEEVLQEKLRCRFGCGTAGGKPLLCSLMMCVCAHGHRAVCASSSSVCFGIAKAVGMPLLCVSMTHIAMFS
jgi:hypothetical protein